MRRFGNSVLLLFILAVSSTTLAEPYPPIVCDSGNLSYFAGVMTESILKVEGSKWTVSEAAKPLDGPQIKGERLLFPKFGKIDVIGSRDLLGYAILYNFDGDFTLEVYADGELMTSSTHRFRVSPEICRSKKYERGTNVIGYHAIKRMRDWLGPTQPPDESYESNTVLAAKTESAIDAGGRRLKNGVTYTVYFLLNKTQNPKPFRTATYRCCSE